MLMWGKEFMPLQNHTEDQTVETRVTRSSCERPAAKQQVAEDKHRNGNWRGVEGRTPPSLERSRNYLLRISTELSSSSTAHLWHFESSGLEDRNKSNFTVCSKPWSQIARLQKPSYLRNREGRGRHCFHNDMEISLGVGCWHNSQSTSWDDCIGVPALVPVQALCVCKLREEAEDGPTTWVVWVSSVWLNPYWLLGVFEWWASEWNFSSPPLPHPSNGLSLKRFIEGRGDRVDGKLLHFPNKPQEQFTPQQSLANSGPAACSLQDHSLPCSCFLWLLLCDSGNTVWLWWKPCGLQTVKLRQSGRFQETFAKPFFFFLLFQLWFCSKWGGNAKAYKNDSDCIIFLDFWEFFPPPLHNPLAYS